MEALEKKLEYHELIMTLDNLNNIKHYDLPEGFKFVFWNIETDLNDWVNIHINSGEFISTKEAKDTFYTFYSNFLTEINKRCIFIVDDENKKVATATVSKVNENGYSCVIDWLAIDKEYWGNKLAKPLISKTLELAKNLGYDRILLHTQTHSWVAAKLYLDFGFNPFNLEEGLKGWQILKTLTNHEKLKDIEPIKEKEMYFIDAINIVKELDKRHKNYTYQIWHKNGRHEVWVRENNLVYKYQYYDRGKKLECEINALDEAAKN